MHNKKVTNTLQSRKTIVGLGASFPSQVSKGYDNTCQNYN